MEATDMTKNKASVNLFHNEDPEEGKQVEEMF